MRPLLWISFLALVTAHAVLVMAMFAAFFILPIRKEWYEALPLMAFIWFFSTTKVPCKLTDLENLLRTKLGMKRIGGFVGHYFIKPVGIILGLRKSRRNLHHQLPDQHS